MNQRPVERGRSSSPGNTEGTAGSLHQGTWVVLRGSPRLGSFLTRGLRVPEALKQVDVPNASLEELGLFCSTLSMLAVGEQPPSLTASSPPRDLLGCGPGSIGAHAVVSSCLRGGGT